MSTRIPQDLLDLLNSVPFASSNGMPMRVALGDLIEQAMDVNPMDVLSGTADPTVLPGVAGDPGDLYLRNAPGADGGELWVKVTDADTGWSLVSVAGATDHGSLLGLGDDDHPQYALVAAMAPTQTLYVDGNRVDAYTETGSRLYPFKTIQAAVDRVALLDGGPLQSYTVSIQTGKYYETVTIEDLRIRRLTLAGEGGVVQIRPTANQSLKSTANNANLAQFHMKGITFLAPVVITGGNGSTAFGDVIWDDCNFVAGDGGQIADITITCINNLTVRRSYLDINTVTYSNVNYSVFDDSNIGAMFAITMNSTANLPSQGAAGAALVDSSLLMGAPTFTKVGTATLQFIANASTLLAGFSGGAVTIPAGVTVSAYDSFLRGTWTNNSVLNLRNSNVAALAGTAPVLTQQPASQVGNDSGVSGASVRDALDALDGGFKVVSVVSAATTVGGAPAEVVANAAVQAGDLVHWSILDGGAGAVKGVSAVAGAGSITFTFSANPSNDTVISYIVARTIP